MNLKKKLVLIIGLMILLICSFIGCQQEESLSEEQPSFLSIDKEFDFLNMSPNELKIYLAALQRLDIEEDDDGFLYIKQASGLQVNISECLYDFFCAKVEEANQRMFSSDINYSIPRTRTSREGENDVPMDCVARSVSDILGWLGTSSSSSDISSWIKDEYKTDDVFGDDYYDVMNHYFRGSPMAIPPYQTGYDFVKQPFKVLGVLGRPEGGIAHSVTVLSISNNNVWYYDNQNAVNGICTIIDIRYLYRVDGVR
ncbi:hypothetical protein [Bacteroides thetaiotaomicron]|uniref:hypothetical protein n=1 Tax=Bacteroides thetaiotaomicron TaxID=818 RepID=UPI0034A34518